MVSVVVAIGLIIAICLCLKGIFVCIAASVAEPVFDYTLIIIAITSAIILIGYNYFNICVAIVL